MSRLDRETDDRVIRMNCIDRETRIFFGVLGGWVSLLAVVDLVLWLLHLRAPERIPISG